MNKRPAKRLVKKEDVAQVTNLQHAQIRLTIEQQDAAAGFLRRLADQTADDPGLHPEITKSATLLAIFLEKNSKAARQQYPDAFKE